MAFDTRDGFSHRGGYTKNPYNLTSDIYGSSSGSAAAVAANLAMAALGTETEGSIIAPSSVTALYGFKPTFDAQLNQGVIPLARSMDTVISLAFTNSQVGVLARTAGDCVAVARAITSRPDLGLPVLATLKVSLHNPFADGRVSASAS